MQSHHYAFTAKEALKICATPILPILLFALAMHAGAARNLLPPPRPTLDTDQTIMVHQAETTRKTNEAKIILLGDSSCMMGIAAVQLSERLGHGTLNIGTLSYLDLETFALMVREYLRTNPGRVKAVVLMLHPEALRRTRPEEFHVNFLRNFYKNADPCPPAKSARCLLGLHILQNRVLTRFIPSPLRGAYGLYYGFSDDLEHYLTRNGGSAVDPGSQAFRGNRDFFLAPQLQKASATFHAAVPREIKLIIGITPIPESFALPNYSVTYHEMLAQWGQWIQADAQLTDLPPAFPDRYFRRTTHLNEAGITNYTSQLADQLLKLNLFMN